MIKKHDYVITLIVLAMLFLVILSSCEIKKEKVADVEEDGADAVDTGVLEESAQYSPDKSDREAARKILSNKGKDVEEVPPPPSIS